MCPTLTMGSFFRRVRSTFLFICSTTSNLNNSNLKSASKTKRRNKTDVRNLEITLRIPHSTLFSALCDFFETFWIAQTVPPSFFRHFATQWKSKNPKGPPFYIFRHCDTVQKSHFQNFFWEIFSSPQRAPPHFFHILQPAGVSQSPKGPPFYNFEP